MLRNILIPERVNSSYLFKQRIVAIDIQKTTIFATIVQAYGKHRTIEACIQEPIIIEPTLDWQDSAGNALILLMKRVGKYDKIYLTLSGSQIIFKELTLPFSSLTKIKMVLPFEIEPLLPFTLDQATFDVLITEQAGDQSTVLVVAVKNDYLEPYKKIFQIAQVNLDRITVGLLETMSLYKSIPELSSQPGATILIDLGFSSTACVLFLDGIVKSLRILPISVINTEASLQNILQSITFSITAMMSKFLEHPLSAITITGPGVELKEIESTISSEMHVPCKSWSIHTIIRNNTIKAQSGVKIDNAFLHSLAAALALEETQEFNLNKQEAEHSQESLIFKQLIMGSAFLLIIISSLVINTFFTTRRLRQEMTASEQEVIKRMKDEFSALKNRRDAVTLKRVNELAKAEVNKEEAIWFALSLQNRDTFLYTLQELSTRIDRAGLGLELKRLAMDEQSVTLEGQVSSFSALRILEEELSKSPLFVNVPKLQEKSFSIKLILAKPEGTGR